MPAVPDLAHLNELLHAGCRQDEQRTLAGRTQTIGATMTIEREQLLPLAKEGFDLAAVSHPQIDHNLCAKVRTNFYSVPVPVGTRVTARLHAAYVEFWHDGRCVARHERCFERHQKVLELNHYLETLLRKPGALAGSTALEQCRQQGRCPESFDRYWRVQEERQGRAAGTRAWIELLLLGRDRGYARLQKAVEKAMALGCADPSAVRYLLHDEGLIRSPAEAVDVGELRRYDRPLPTLEACDLLLERAPITEVTQ